MTRETRGGFTLIELLVVIAIIGLLSSIVLGSLGQARSKARDSKRVQDLLQLKTALELYASNNNGLYPPDPVNPTDPGGLSCWDCPVTNPSLGPYHDLNRLLALEQYIKPRPTDPKIIYALPSFPYEGYWYKVSESRKNYKLVIIGSIENINSTPTQMRDPLFLPSWSNTISIWSNNASKNWTHATPVRCVHLNDC